MQKILGLDLGSYSIKAIEILNTFKTYRVTAFHEVVMPEIEGLDPRAVGTTAIKQLFAENEIDADRTYTAMLGLHVSMRVLQLHNVKKRNIPAVVQNELESQAPFAIDDTIIDQQILDHRDGVTTVLAVMCLKDHIESYLSGLKDCNIEPKVIDVDYLSFMNLLPFLDFGGEAPTDEARKIAAAGSQLILDIGHAKTSIVLFNDGHLVSARTVRLGGRFFTEYLQKSLNVSYNEAQRLKHTFSSIRLGRQADHQESTSQEEQLVCRHLSIAVNELVKELIRTLHSFKAHERIVPSSIVLTGGSAVIRNLPEYLHEVLEIPVRTMAFDQQRLHIDDPSINASPNIAQALATGLRGVPGKTHSQINLRKGELALVGSYDTIIKQVSNVTLLAASLLLCLVGSFALRWWLYGTQINELKVAFRNEVIRIVGQEPRQLRNIAAGTNWSLAAYSNSAIKFINEEISNRRSVINEFAARKSAYPLRILNSMSEIIPTDLRIDVTNFYVQGKTLNFEGETDSFSNSERLLGILQKATFLGNVERKSQENKPGTDGKVIKFVFSAEIKEGA
jgi:type IV pilus assembly protein PilM